MATCEKCWKEAAFQQFRDGTDQPTAYRKLLAENDCTPEEQAGIDAGYCASCARQTVHQYARICMVCGAKPPPEGHSWEDR